MLFVSLIIIISLTLYIISIHNSFIKKINAVKESKSGIKIQIKKKLDLIPNLLKVLQKYMSYEESLLKDLVKIREGSSIENTESLTTLNSDIDNIFKSAQLKVEAYPDLKSSEQFLSFNKELSSIETNIAAARRIFNMSVNSYNNSIQVFPNSILANIQKKTVEKLFSSENDDLLNKSLDIDFEKSK